MDNEDDNGFGYEDFDDDDEVIDYDFFGGNFDLFEGRDMQDGEETWRPAVASGNLSQLQDLVRERGLAVLSENIENPFGTVVTTPLLEAASRQHMDMVRFLLEECSSVIDINACRYFHFFNYEEQGFTSLHFAMQSNNLELARYLVEKGCDINAVASAGYKNKMALHMVVEVNSLELVRYLVEKGSDVNAAGRYGETPLHIAVKTEHVDIVKVLIDTGLCNLDLATSNRDEPAAATPLLLAVDPCKNLEIVQLLLERGPWTEREKADRATKVLPGACKCGNLEMAKYLVESCQANVHAPDFDHSDGCTPLLLACERGSLDLVQYLVEKCHASVELRSGCKRHVNFLLKSCIHITMKLSSEDKENMNPLLAACASGHLGVVQYLVEKCDANVEMTREGSKQGTPLHLACQSGALDVVRYLVEKCRVDVEATDNEGNTALHDAARFLRMDVVQHLVEKCGSNIETRNDNECTALHMACQKSTTAAVAVVKYFVDVCCVDVNVPNTQGETALHVASRHRNVEMVQCLVHSGRIDVNAADANGRTAMHICIVGQSNHRIVGDAENVLQIAKILAAVDQTWFETRDEDGRTVLLPYSNWHNTWCKNVA